MRLSFPFSRSHLKIDFFFDFGINPLMVITASVSPLDIGTVWVSTADFRR